MKNNHDGKVYLVSSNTGAPTCVKTASKKRRAYIKVCSAYGQTFHGFNLKIGFVFGVDNNNHPFVVTEIGTALTTARYKDDAYIPVFLKLGDNWSRHYLSDDFYLGRVYAFINKNRPLVHKSFKEPRKSVKAVNELGAIYMGRKYTISEIRDMIQSFKKFGYDTTELEAHYATLKAGDVCKFSRSVVKPKVVGSFTKYLPEREHRIDGFVSGEYVDLKDYKDDVEMHDVIAEAYDMNDALTYRTKPSYYLPPTR